MSDVSDDEGSQRTRQTTATSVKSKSRMMRDWNKTNKKLRGDVEELHDNVYTYGTRNQGDKFVKTTEAIGDYVGREYNKAMRMLVRKKKETTPSEPDEPKGKNVTDAQWKRYEKELDRYLKKLDEYNEFKAKVFVIVIGQCTLTMKNKVESLDEFENLEDGDDVIGLLEVIKSLAYTTHKVQYEHWTTCGSMRRMLTMRQYDEESLAAFYKRFTNSVDVTEGQWGKLIPNKIVMNNKSEDDVERKKFLACVFIAGVDAKRYGKLVDELNNSYIAGNNNYPGTIEGAVSLLSHYMDGNQQQQNGKDRWKKGQRTSESSFLQHDTRNVRCFKCGKKGHYANDCEEEEIDDDASIGSRVRRSRTSNAISRGASRARGGWSG